MEENNNQNSSNTTSEEIKKQTVNTAKQVKDTVKNINIKEEYKTSKDTIVSMFKDPIGTVENVADDKENKFFKTSLFLIIVWAVIRLISKFITGIKAADIMDEDLGWILSEYIFELSTLWSILAPALIVLVYSGIAYALNKNNKKSIPEIMSVVTIAYLPVIVSAIITLLNFISDDMYKITGVFSTILSITKTILLYFGLKNVFADNDDKSFIKKFIVIIAIYEVIAFVLAFAKIYI